MNNTAEKQRDILRGLKETVILLFIKVLKQNVMTALCLLYRSAVPSTQGQAASIKSDT